MRLCFHVQCRYVPAYMGNDSTHLNSKYLHTQKPNYTLTNHNNIEIDRPSLLYKLQYPNHQLEYAVRKCLVRNLLAEWSLWGTTTNCCIAKAQTIRFSGHDHNSNLCISTWVTLPILITKSTTDTFTNFSRNMLNWTRVLKF